MALMLGRCAIGGDTSTCSLLEPWILLGHHVQIPLHVGHHSPIRSIQPWRSQALAPPLPHAHLQTCLKPLCGRFGELVWRLPMCLMADPPAAACNLPALMPHPLHGWALHQPAHQLYSTALREGL